MNQSSAATTGLFDLQTGQWSQIILSAIFARADGVLDEKSPVARLEECLGNVTEDEGEAVST
jgi:sugar (pentulose or hexulose) kinase